MNVVVCADVLDLPVTGCGGLGVRAVVAHLQQLDEQRAIVAHRVPEILCRGLPALARAGNAVRGPVLLDEIGMFD